MEIRRNSSSCLATTRTAVLGWLRLPVSLALVHVLATPAMAAVTLTVDLSTSYRPVSHVGVGFLYGLTEKKPADADLERLVGALHPKMFTNPASSDPGTQQPSIPANAIKVAARLAPLGGTVTVRFSDWLSGFYTFTTMDDWFAKLGTTISAKKAANLTNIYAYELWNEPNGTWTSGSDPNAVPGGTKTLSFNAFWKQTYDKVRQLDPTVKITGPSISWCDVSFLRPFLTYCKTNSCLPDIIGWHEGQSIANDVQNYRNLEKELGIGPLPITMNEYSGSGRINDEGRPGASAPLIAQLERAGVETASVTWWAPDSVAGHLGSLLASDTEPNGGWYLYKWYGDMTGNMVSTQSSLSTDGRNLDGFASLDTNAQYASIILAGVSDGTVQVVVKGFKAAAFFGNSVHAVVEHTRWTSRSSVSAGTDTLSSADLPIANDQVAVSVTGVNGDDGYRVRLTSVGTGVDGGAGSGGRTGTGGASGADGRIGTGGSSGASAGGNLGAGGVSGSGGVAGTDGGIPNRDAVPTGGDSSGSGGSTGGQVGSGGTAGLDADRDAPASSGGAGGFGATGAGGRNSGGASTSSVGGGGVLGGSGGTSAGGSRAVGPGSGGASPGTGGMAGTRAPSRGGSAGGGDSSPGGCTCQIGRASSTAGASFLFLLALAWFAVRRRPSDAGERARERER
jgi:hypothetical protein